MGDDDRATVSNDPAANAPDAAAAEKVKGKAVDTSRDYEMGESEDIDTSESESAEEMGIEEEEEDHDNLEPISQANILPGGRRTRGKAINFAQASEQFKAEGDEMEDDEDDVDFVAGEDQDNQMRD